MHKSYSHVKGWGIVSANGLVVVDKRNAFIIDTPWSEQDTRQLTDWIRSKNYNLLGSVSTHSHEDRTAGITWLNEQAIATYASAQTNQLLAAANREQASHSILGQQAKLANGMVEIYYPGAGHTQDNIVVWLPKSKVLFGGCFIRSLQSKGLGYTGEADVTQWPKSMENVIAQYPAAKIIVPGHGKAGTVELLTHTHSLAEKAAKQSALTTIKTNTD